MSFIHDRIPFVFNCVWLRIYLDENIWKFCFETLNTITWVNMQQQKNGSSSKGLLIYDK